MALEQREVEAPAEHAGTHGGHPSPKEYVRIGVILGVLTALEIGASYAGVGTGILIPTLFILAVVKFALVVMWFMHLRFDDRRYARFFVMGLAGASVLYLIVLISLRVFA
ncbi:MAG TPA: cytochrome C oxidase subunit IV family protein [Actinomycetota bacterium]|nr:cytochrome C oxidase subunit IV family protein [Actinomycetota bacterium]